MWLYRHVLKIYLFSFVTWRILSWAAGVRGVRSPVTVLVTLYSDRRADEAELPLSLSSAAWRATSLARPNLTTSSSSASLIYEEQIKALQGLIFVQPARPKCWEKLDICRWILRTCGDGKTNFERFLVNSATPLVCRMAEGRSLSFFFLIFCLSFFLSLSSCSL